MKPFAYVRPKTEMEALSLLSPKARPKGGGIDLLDLSKSGHPAPEILVDLRSIAGDMPPIMLVTGDPGGMQDVWILGRAVLAEIASSTDLRRHCPAIAEAAGEAATPLIRNVATLAGNILQRPRCVYFMDPFFDCLKRGGASCPAMEGEHSEGAIFGNSRCCATHPSNLATALVALDARCIIHKWTGKMDEVLDVSRPAAEFFVAPEEDPLRENRIGTDEFLQNVVLKPSPASAYVEIDQKQSFDWASASCAVALQMEGGKVKEARIVLGAVAPIPWRAKAAEEALVGKVPNEKAAQDAAEAAVKGATPLRDNAHKVQHARVCVKRAILKAAERGR